MSGVVSLLNISTIFNALTTEHEAYSGSVLGKLVAVSVSSNIHFIIIDPYFRTTGHSGGSKLTDYSTLPATTLCPVLPTRPAI